MTPKTSGPWRRIPGGARGLAVAILLVLSLPTLNLGFMIDDYILNAMADGNIPARPLDYYTFARSPEQVSSRMVRGPLPWFTLPELRLSFCRPLSSALVLADRALFGERVWLYHLHSILWMLALLWFVGALFRQVLSSGAASLAMVLFAIDDSHALPTAWLANRNALVASVPVVLGLLAHLRFRRTGWGPGRWLGALGLAVGLLGGEPALAVAAYFLSYELWSKDPISVRLKALAPVVGVLVVWAIAYRSLGFGAYGSSSYLDPGRQTLAFLGQAPGRLLALLSPLTLGLTADIWLVIPAGRPVLVAAGSIGVVLVALALRGAWSSLASEDRQAIQWLGTGAVLALIPGLAAFPLNRLVLAASIGSLATLAVLLRSAWERRRQAVIRWLVFAHLVLPPIGWVAGSRVLHAWARAGQAAILDVPAEQFTGSVVLLTAPDPSSVMYGGLFLQAAHRPAPARWWSLSLSPLSHRLRRVGERALELEVTEGRMIDTAWEQLLRDANHPFKPGDSVQLDGMRVTVVAEDQGHPTKIRADFDRPLSEHRLMVWRVNTFEEIAAPEQGAVLELPAAPTLLLQAFGIH